MGSSGRICFAPFADGKEVNRSKPQPSDAVMTVALRLEVVLASHGHAVKQDLRMAGKSTIGLDQGGAVVNQDPNTSWHKDALLHSRKQR